MEGKAQIQEGWVMKRGEHRSG